MVDWKGSIRSIGKGITKGSKIVAKGIEKGAKTIHRKGAILDRMSNKQIYAMARHYRIKPTSFFDEKPDANDYQNAIASNLSLDEIIRYAKRHGTRVEDIESKVDDEKTKEELDKMEKNGLIKDSLFKEIINEIRAFKPFRIYNSEYPYQIELGQFLKHRFSMTQIEKQKGSSRPDIIIGDIAIEVKGPTYKEGLDNILSKCIRYPQHYKGGLIIVLFTPRITYKYYNDWLNGMKRTFPEVVVIKK